MYPRVLEINIPMEMGKIYKQVKHTPFYQKDNIYHFALHTLQSNKLFSPFFNMTVLEPSDSWLAPYLQITQGILDQLTNLTIEEDDMAVWLSHQRQQGNIITYHQILEDYHQKITLLVIQNGLISCQRSLIRYSDDDDMTKESKLHNIHDPQAVDLVKMTRLPLQTEKIQNTNNGSVVLNRNNPFADVSIHDQTFIYASGRNTTEKISLSTSHTVTRIQKNDQKSLIVLQPGFKIKKEQGKKIQKSVDIIFDDTLSTEILQEDDYIYAYIN